MRSLTFKKAKGLTEKAEISVPVLDSGSHTNASITGAALLRPAP